jgi:VWFA-related protein
MPVRYNGHVQSKSRDRKGLLVEPGNRIAPLVLLTLLSGPSRAFAQTASPPNQVQTAPSPSPSQPQYTLRARVPLTILDVVVTDAKGQPVHGLKQSDFTILEDGKQMTPNSFEEHHSDALSESPAAIPAKLDLPPNTFTNVAPALPKSNPIDILLIDNLNTPTSVQQIVRKQLLSFVDKMRPGTRVAVFGLNYRIFILQGFTSDPELLKAAINDKKNVSLAPTLEDIGQDLTNDPPGSIPIPCDTVLEHEAARGQYSITAMKQIARYLSGVPGRKNLVWFAGSFPLQDMCPDGDQYDLTADIHSATDALARAHVAIYPVDPRAMDALAQGNQGVAIKQAVEHLTMDALAEPTGGKSTYNSNDLAGAAVDAIDTGANFYALTYTPLNQTLDSRFRTITVKVDQPGLKLAYRNGYYAIDPGVTLTGAKADKLTPMQSALMRGGLDATQVLFKLKVAQSPAAEQVLPVSNQPDPKQMHPPYRHYTLAFIIDINCIDFAPGIDGNYRGDFEFGARVYNADGDEIVNAASKTVSPILPPAVYNSMLRGGANAHVEIDAPATGDYFLRIAVHDLTSDRVGSIEVPTASIAPETTPAVAAEKSVPAAQP